MIRWASPPDRSMPNFVASCTSSRRPAMPRPTSTSLWPAPSMSAVSMNATPRSRARWMVAIDSSQSVAPYHSLIPMQPRPWADTVNWPSVVVRMLLVLLLEGLLSASVLECVGARREGQAVRVVVDLRVEQLQAFTLAREGPADLLAVLFQQLDAFGLTRAR